MELERMNLAMERIREIPSEDGTSLRCHDFFVEAANFIQEIYALYESLLDGSYYTLDLEEYKALQTRLYQGIETGYEASIYNPAYLQGKYESEIGKVLSVVASELRSMIGLCFDRRIEDILRILELFLEVYSSFRIEDEVSIKTIENIIYYYIFDYLDISLPARVRQMYTGEYSIFRDIIMEEDLSDPRYLFYFGEYVSDTEIEVARYLCSLDEETIQKMADTYTTGYYQGFVAAGKDITKKSYVSIVYPLGFERVIKKAVENFKEMGLESIIYRAPTKLSDKQNGRRPAGCTGSSPNKQYEYDHRFDEAIFYQKAFTDRKLTLMRQAYESVAGYMALLSGHAIMETFGEKLFEPVNHAENYAYSDKQKKLSVSYNLEALQLRNEFMSSEETSFTIIAWPVPEIDKENYREIFDDIIRINTLDYQLYQDIQQKLIDTLDKADSVRIIGKGENRTDMTVSLHKLHNPEKETNFENCVADVNIPVGEVFTSPLLTGTNGLLNVRTVYIGDIEFKNLKLYFTEGMITEYSCDNFENPAEGKKLIEEVLLKNHESLPLGEFAIGTNTTAYRVAKKYDIFRKLPILIAEKMGPHFAIGDTCYSHEEDVLTYNPDGKAIIARENEVSSNRKTDMSKAYFACHTDITIPYDELADIYTIKAGQRLDFIIKDGRFAVEGTESLNKELE